MAWTPLRKVLAGAAGVIAIAVAAGVYLAATFDPNAYKGLAIDYMKDKRNRTLAIDGPVKLSIFPRLALTLSKVTLSEHGRPAEFAHVDEVSLSVAVMPLLGKRVEVDRISARGVRMAYRRDAKGASNIDDLLAPSGSEPPADGASKKPLAFDISRIDLANVALSVQDDLAKVKGTATIVSFSTGRIADGVDSPVELDAQLALSAPAAKGHLRGRTRVQPDLKSGGVALRGMDLQWTGDALGVRQLDTTLSGAAAYDPAAGTVSADGIDLRVSGALGALVLENSRAEVKKFAYDPARKLLSVNTLALKVAGTQSGNPLALSLDWPLLTVTGDSLSGGPLTGSVSLKGATSIEADFKSAAPRGNFERIEVPALETTLKGRSGPRGVSGNLRADLRLDAAARALAVDGLTARLSIEEPSLQPLKLSASGRAGASATAAQWALKGDINGNPFETDGRVGLADKPLSVTANASFQSLDLNRLLPAGGGASGGSGPAATAKEGIDLSALRSLQGRFHLRAGTLAYQHYRATGVNAQAVLSAGVLRAAPLSAGLWGGRVDASATADANQNRFALKASADGVDVQALLKDVADKDLLEGTGRVTADLDTAGRTVGALKSALRGSAALQLRDGAVKGVNLARQLRQARAALSMKADTGTASIKTEKTDFSELSASFAIQAGIARNDDLTLKSPFLRVGGAGSVDIPQARIDYTVRATVAETSKGQGGAELADLRGITVPVHLTGPLDAIAWNIRWSAVAADLLKTQAGKQVEDKLRERLNEKLGLPPRAASTPEGSAPKPRDVLKDRLKGLLR